ncbi:zona pellucida-like domain protein [Ancylostoma ceylanicum]|uniref:Zona pellucida-like domain protein n=1 Tax=Ancylostoma ceylanicum TaxID=53326 RepID=A0A0D6M851_9BILA|nr:zona pellucida-like domain protein [Ancylostoma ceylanicum]
MRYLSGGVHSNRGHPKRHRQFCCVTAFISVTNARLALSNRNSVASKTTVILNAHACVSLNIDDYYGLIDANQFLRKHCILGAPSGSVVRIHPEKFLDYPSEKIVHAKDEYDCLSSCMVEKEFHCKSANFFTESGDCLLNNATSLNASILENAAVYYMERQKLREKKRCSRSFHMIPWNHMVIRGEAKLWNVPGGFAKCLGLCHDCDYVVYNEYYGECFLVYYDQFGQKFNFINEGYQASHWFFLAFLVPICIADQMCKYAYVENSTCLISAKERPLQKLIEKHCVGFDDVNVVKRKGEARKKPSKSRHPLRAKAHSDSKKNQIKIRKEFFAEGGIELNVETICNYDSVVVKVTSPVHVDGKLFPRNAHGNCSITINGTKAELRMPLNSKRCSLTKVGLLFENVIVVKQNTLRDLPVITEYDQLYRISCDYTNHTTKMSATSILRLREGDYSRLSPMGKVPYPPMKMELRSKPEKEVRTVILGQDVDLTIEDEDNIVAGNFTISNCVASGMGSHDNITLIEDGCPTRPAREYIVRGGIKKESSGFSIPLRAFRFKNSDGVRIRCRLDTCKQECVQPSCSTKSRRRRYLTEASIDPEESEEVEITLVVNDETRIEVPDTVEDASETQKIILTTDLR